MSARRPRSRQSCRGPASRAPPRTACRPHARAPAATRTQGPSPCRMSRDTPAASSLRTRTKHTSRVTPLEFGFKFECEKHITRRTLTTVEQAELAEAEVVADAQAHLTVLCTTIHTLQNIKGKKQKKTNLHRTLRASCQVPRPAIPGR